MVRYYYIFLYTHTNKSINILYTCIYTDSCMCAYKVMHSFIYLMSDGFYIYIYICYLLLLLVKGYKHLKIQNLYLTNQIKISYNLFLFLLLSSLINILFRKNIYAHNSWRIINLYTQTHTNNIYKLSQNFKVYYNFTL